MINKPDTFSALLPSTPRDVPTRHYFTRREPHVTKDGVTGDRLIYTCAVTGRERVWGFEA